MSLTYPDSRAIATTTAAIGAGGYALAMVLLAGGASTATILYANRFTEAWPLIAAFVLVAAGGSVVRWAVDIPRRAMLVAAALIASGIWLAASTMAALQPADRLSSSSYFFSNLTIATVFLGATVRGAGHAAVAVIAATAGAQTMVILAVVSAGGTPSADVPALCACTIVAFVLAGLEFQRRRARSSAKQLARAENETRVAAFARSAALQRVAILHDTVLSDLAALSALAPGQLPAAVRSQLTETLSQLHRGEGPGPLAALTTATSPTAIGDLLGARSAHATPIAVTGDPRLVDILDVVQREAMLAALAQCLVNVDKHAGAQQVEVFIGATEETTSIMVVDDGIGFDPAAVAPDKLGLKTSIIARMSEVGGRAEVWSSPGGQGTTVVLSVPTLATATDDGSPAGALS